MTAREALLKLLTQAPAGKLVNSVDVNALVGERLSRQATTKAAKKLRKQGYDVVSTLGRNGGFELVGREVGHGMGNH